MKRDTVIYCDAKGKEHDALVFAVNPMNPTYQSLVYVDEAKPESDNVVKVFDVRHMDTISEPNPALPTYHLNCWKEKWTSSNALPADHPAYDHPHLPTSDQDGKAIPHDRPEYDAHIAAHVAARQPSAADLDVVAAEQKAAEDTSGAGESKPKARVVKGSK